MARGVDGVLERFIHAGMDPETVDAIGERTKDQGVLGTLISSAPALRLELVTSRPWST